MAPLLEAKKISKQYVSGTFFKKRNLALREVTFSIKDSPPSITAIAGESGSGKTTMARVLSGILDKTSGEIIYKGKSIDNMNYSESLEFKKEVQTIFQDPFEVYNPFYKVDHVLTTPLKKFGITSNKSDSDKMILSALQEVGLRPDETLGRFPHQLSGGQRQRIMVARAFLLRPKIIIADEPVSMVDASLRATILEELKILREKHGISIVYITHDLTTAYQVADNILILYKGQVVEAGEVEHVINDPKHPYTKLLVDCIPQPNPDVKWGISNDSTDIESRIPSECNNNCLFCIKDGNTNNLTPMYQVNKTRTVSCKSFEKSKICENQDISSYFAKPKF
tara:strand:+ start:285 stop:1298 length:1014 start_codon:yes stop_codon:yes gene_type:complete